MSADYCDQCAGDPRRKANAEPHKAHAPAQPADALPADSKEDWLELPD